MGLMPKSPYFLMLIFNTFLIKDREVMEDYRDSVA